MSKEQTDSPTPGVPLRLWPGVVLLVLQWLSGFILPVVAPDTGATGPMGALLAGVLIVVWWAFLSRAPRSERWGGAVLLIVALGATRPLLHESVRNAGMGVVYFLYALPILCLALVLWAAAGRRLAAGPRRAALVATTLVACAGWTLVRTSGVTGGGDWDFAWRWSETPEDRLLARGVEPAAGPAAAPPPAVDPGWPGFRGPRRDSVIRGVRIASDWATAPPVELWRRPIGPGWSSFAVAGRLLYTQEQRGDDELVSCHDAATGEPVWRHRDAARFWEPQSGPGPRATPTLHDGRVYTLGATGILNALDAADGAVAWSRNAAADTGAEIPGWGFSSSPLVVDDLVIVHAGKLAAYDIATGAPRWFGPPGGSYSSPQLATIDGLVQIVMVSYAGTFGVDASDGSLLWKDSWSGGIVQPAVTAAGDILIPGGGMSGGSGLRRIALERGPGGWATRERWTSNRLKPNFNDFVVHRGHAYGFDGSILAAIDLADGRRAWKGGRYGNGQLVLLPDQDLLLVLSERGDLALVAATPGGFNELARFPALQGKTWNHPVLAGDLLLVRNGQEMAAFRLALADPAAAAVES